MDKPTCPEHGATLCYGEENGNRIYRCELGCAKIVKTKNRDGTMNEHIEYVAATHREYWGKNGWIVEVEPHTSPWGRE